MCWNRGGMSFLLVCIALWEMVSNESKVQAAEKTGSECVVLLHGLARGSGSFWLVEKVLAKLLDGPNDGKVTSIDPIGGADEHLVVHATHTFMMFNPVVIGEIVNFLESGAFNRTLDVPGTVEMLAASFQ